MAEPRIKKLGDKIFDLREVRHYSQEYVAERVGVARQTVSKWEANQTYPTVKKIKLLAQLFNVTVEYLTTDEIIEEKIENNNSADEKLVASDEVPQDETQVVQKDEVQENIVQEEKKSKRNKLSKKTKIIIVAVALTISIIVLLLGISMLVFNYLIYEKEAVGSFAPAMIGVAWNFSIENMGWIMFSIALIAVVIFGIILITNNIKYKKYEREQMALNHI